MAAFLAAGLAAGAAAETLLGYPLAFTGMWAFGLTRHAYLLRAQQAERMLAEARRARAAETQAAALAERARISREIHDVLAHSLAAVSVNLQAAEGLLAALPAGSPELAKAMECIGRAGAFTREGLADARRAILALRDDATTRRRCPISCRRWRGSTRPTVTWRSISRSPARRGPVTADVGLAAYRTAQEALTNARKHAPGQPVRLSLDFSAADVAVRVVNPLLAASGPPDAPAGTEELTPREAEVLRLIAGGQSNREIARALYVSEATVETHVNRIFAKTGARDRAQAVRYAYTHGYAEPASPA